MTTSGHEPEFEDLLCALADRELSPEQARRLGALLQQRPELRDRYLSYVETATLLEEELSSIPAIDLKQTVQRLSTQRLRWRVERHALLAASIFLAITFVVTIAWSLRSTRLEVSSQDPPPVGVAVITQAVDAQWDLVGSAADVGQPLPPGKLRLKRGLAQVEFYSGAIVILQGPAELDLLAADRGFFHHGRIRAHVPPQAQGFTIGAPGVEVIDLGTEFGLSLTPQGLAEVHVFEGKVELHDSATQSQKQLTGGQGLQWSPNLQPRAIAVDDEAFVGRPRLADLAGSDRELAVAKWQRFSDDVRARPDLLLYYSFEPDEPWQRMLNDRSRSAAGPGAIVGAQWAEGRWPGKVALEFKRTSDRIRIQVPGSLAAVTLCAWVRIDNFDHQLSALLMCDGAQPGGLRWQVAEDGRLGLTVVVDDRSAIVHRSEPTLSRGDLGRWQHLAVACDPANRRFVHYRNGQRLENARPWAFGSVKGGDKFPNIALTIGSAELGNWNDSGLGTSAEHRLAVRNLNGRVDEFIVLAAALTDEEILQMYEAGKP